MEATGGTEHRAPVETDTLSMWPLGEVAPRFGLFEEDVFGRCVCYSTRDGLPGPRRCGDLREPVNCCMYVAGAREPREIEDESAEIPQRSRVFEVYVYIPKKCTRRGHAADGRYCTSGTASFISHTLSSHRLAVVPLDVKHSPRLVHDILLAATDVTFHTDGIVALSA